MSTHQFLKAHILHLGDILGALEVLTRPIRATLPGVVYMILGDFT